MPLPLHRRLPRVAAVLAATLAIACTSYGPQSLAPAASISDATASMGPPTGSYALPDAGRRVEFARGPFGKHTYMLDFNADGHLVSWNQVLSESRFNEILAGMTEDEVLLRIGHPSERWPIAFQNRMLWNYRFDDLFCRWFQVGIDAQGRVADTGYGLDPKCAHEDHGEM